MTLHAEYITDEDLIKQFRAKDTTTGSFRSYAHAWCGPHGIAAAVDLLVEGRYVELHVCDHSTKSDQTIAVMTLEVEGDSLRFSLNGYSDSKMCSAGEDHKAEMAAHIACRLYAYMTAPSQMVFRQPSTETRKALDEN